MQREVTIASVSWIKLEPNPVLIAAEGIVYSPAWIPKTYVGLAATANAEPPRTITKIENFRSGKQFRALSLCRLKLEIDDKSNVLTRVVPIDSFLDPGYTPPFNLFRPWAAAGWYPTALPGAFPDGLKAVKAVFSTEYSPGERSPISQVVVGGRHKHTAITATPASETVLVDMLVKFRAGPQTDNVGVEALGSPFHVPWVWCETVLTYSSGKFKVYCKGSIFPTHSWYLDGERILVKDRVGDSVFPKKSLTGKTAEILGMVGAKYNPFAIDERRLALYPVLSKGAPTMAGTKQKSVEGENDLKGSVEKHPNTVEGGALNTNERGLIPIGVSLPGGRPRSI